MNNTNKHISDESLYVKFNPTGTSFPSNIVNVQAALAAIKPEGVTGVPLASQTVVGKARFATQAEVYLGQSNTLMVSPATLEVRLQRPEASETVLGVTRYATKAEALAGTANNRSIVATSLKHVIDWNFANRKASETVIGLSKFSTTAAATAGIDDTTSMTPLKTKQAIAAATAIIPVYGPAKESEQGLVRLATLAQLRGATIREGYSMSPFVMNQWQATETNMGAGKIASQAAMDAGTDNNSIVTPYKFKSTRANTTRAGTVILTTTVNGNSGMALAGNSKVLPSEGNQAINGALYQGSVADQNKYVTKTELNNTVAPLQMPVGTMMLAAYNSDQGNLFIANGRMLNRNTYSELFARIGYTYGGGGDNFALPDTRGVVVRGLDNGRNLDSGRSLGSYQADAMQRITAAWVMDDFAVESRWPTGAINAGRKGAVRYDAKSYDNRDAYYVELDSARQTRTAGETRVKNIALNYVICVR